MTDRYLPAVPREFALLEREPLAVGLRRLTVEQFDRLLVGLGDGVDLDWFVHETRKATKRVRAVLRLVRSEIGERAYAAENAILRDAARLLAPMRDDRVLALSVEGLRGRYRSALNPAAFGELERRLTERALDRRERVVRSGALDQVAMVLRSARVRYAAWPVPGDPTVGLYGRKPVKDRFSSIADGLDATYRRGRHEMKAALAHGVPEEVHAWRKRVKYLRHQTEALVPLFPDVLAGSVTALEHLGELLGSDHDLAVLIDEVERSPHLCPDPFERSLLIALARHRRRELLDASAVIGRRIYAEPPKQFVARLSEYWDVSHSADTPPRGLW